MHVRGIPQQVHRVFTALIVAGVGGADYFSSRDWRRGHPPTEYLLMVDIYCGFGSRRLKLTLPPFLRPEPQPEF